MRIEIKLNFAILFLFPIVVWSQPENKEGIIIGKVVNVSFDSNVVVNQKVILHKFIGDEKIQDTTSYTYTDNHGRFAFKEVEINERMTYYPFVNYGGIEYSGKIVQLSPSAPRQCSDICVFDPTSLDTSISISVYHLMIEPGAGNLIIREVFIFVNKDNYTCVGDKKAANGKIIVLRMELPEDAKDLQISGDLMSCCAVIDGNQVYDTMEFKPGTRQIELKYFLPYKNKEKRFTKTFAYNSESFDVFVHDPVTISRAAIHQGAKESSSESEIHLEESKSFTKQNMKYQRYHANNVTKGSTIDLSISGNIVFQYDYRWTAPIILFLIIAGTFVLKRRNK